VLVAVVLAAALGLSAHLEQSKSTEFCSGGRPAQWQDATGALHQTSHALH
jgi:hypothetical protein